MDEVIRRRERILLEALEAHTALIQALLHTEDPDAAEMDRVPFTPPYHPHGPKRAPLADLPPRRSVVVQAESLEDDDIWEEEEDSEVLTLGNAETEATEQGLINFEPGEPRSFDEYIGQPTIKDYLMNLVRGLSPDELSIRNMLFLGPPGLGKTTLAKCLASVLRERQLRLGYDEPDYIEVFPSQVPNSEALDRLMYRALQRPGSVIFIDELHDVKNDAHWRPLYTFLTDRRYQFANEPNPIKFPATTVVAATTDYGEVPAPLLARFTDMMLEAATPDDLQQMMARRPFPISRPAADVIVQRVGQTGVPREVLTCYTKAVDFAKGAGKDLVTLDEVRQAFALDGVDRHGLRKIDRRVLEVLFNSPQFRAGRGGSKEFTVFAAKGANVAQIAGIDPAYYERDVVPRLMQRGLVMSSSKGTTLTPKAIMLYSVLNPTPYGKKEVA